MGRDPSFQLCQVKIACFIGHTSYPNIDGDVPTAGHLQRGLWSGVEVKAAVSWEKGDTCQVVDLFEWDEGTMNMLKENKTTLSERRKNKWSSGCLNLS